MKLDKLGGAECPERLKTPDLNVCYYGRPVVNFKHKQSE